MDQTKNNLFREKYNPFEVRGNYLSIGSKFSFDGDLRIYEDGKITGIVFDQGNSRNPERKMVLGVKKGLHLNLWTLSNSYSGEIYSMVNEETDKNKYHGGKSHSPAYFDQLIERICKEKDIRKLFLKLPEKNIAEILDSIEKVDKKIIENSFGRTLTAKVFSEGTKSNLELTPQLAF